MSRNTFLSPAGTNAGAKVIQFPELTSTNGQFFSDKFLSLNLNTREDL